MADNLNIKNPSVRQGDLDLRTDASGNIVSISGHPIAGGGGGGTTYYGDNDYIQIKNGTVNTFTVTDKVKDVVDNLTEKIALQVDAQTYNKNDIDTKLSAKQDELVFAGYEDKIETINGSGFIVNGYVSEVTYQIDKNNYNKQFDYLSASVSSKQDKLIFEYDEDNKVSAINGSALASQGGTTYTPGQYINIDSNNEISVTGVVASDEYATYSGDWNDVSNSYKTNSGSFLTNEDLTNYATKTYVDSKDPVLIGDSNVTATSSTIDGHTQWNLAVNVTPVVTDTKLVGDNCVTAHTTQTSGEWKIGLEQSAYEAIDSIGGIVTDVTTLKNASAGWNDVTAKLDASVASTTYQTKEDMVNYLTKSDASTTYQPKGSYLVADDITGKLDKSIYSNASGKWENTYNVVNQYSAAGTWLTAHQSLTNYYTKNETSGAGELSTEFAKYVTSSNVTTQGADYVMTTTGWKVLTLPGGGMTQVIHDETLTGQGNDANSKLGVVWSALSGNTIDSAKSADVAMYYYDTVDNMPIGISTTINGIYNTLDNYLLTGDIMPDNGISGGYNSQAQSFELGLTQTAYNAVTSVSSKVDKPTSLADKYLVLRTDSNGDVSGWCDFQDQSYSKSEALGTFVATANIDSTTLSGDGKSVSTKLGVKTDVIATIDYVSGNYLPLSGGTVLGDVIVSSTGTCLLTVGTEATLMGQSRVVNMGDTTARGTNWLGVSQSNQGFLKYVNGGNVGALNGTSIQINFAPDGANSYGNITVNSQDNVSKVVHIPTASYNSMSSFDNTNGPNYMLRKTASGFDIGAAVINVTSLPQQIEANAYYFVYDV